jgi:hypothetical protein
MTDAFPFPFDLDRVASPYCTFCVTLVTRRAGSLPREVDSPAVGTANRTSRRPMYSAVLYQLKK